MDIYASAYEILKGGDDLVLATVIHKRGSSPRTAGTAMIVRRDGSITGTIGGGLVEAETVKLAPGLFRDRGAELRTFDMTGKLVSAMDMICGGTMEVLAQYVPSDGPTLEKFRALVNELQEEKGARMLTALDEPDKDAGGLRRFVLLPSDKKAPEGLSQAVMRQAMDLDRSCLIEDGRKRYWVDVAVNRGHLVIFGAGHVSGALYRCALPIGFRVTVLDDRPEFASRERFPGPADLIVLRSFEEPAGGFVIDEDTCVVILTRGHLYDRVVLEQALGTRAGYIGMIGSMRKRDAIYADLRKKGFTDSDLERVHCPIGIAIGAESPEEIAVSITAELISHRNKRKG